MQPRSPLTDLYNKHQVKSTESTKNQVEAGSESLFDQLPLETLWNIGEYLSPLEQSKLSRTRDKWLFTAFFPARPVARELIEKLAHYLVVKPNVDEVIKMVKANPILLQTVIPKIEINNTLLIENKPFQLAYGSWNEEMCAALKKAMIDVLGSEEAAIEEIQKQIAEKFPEDKENDDRIKNKLASMLHAVGQAITKEQFNLGQDDKNRWILSNATLDAIDGFSKELDELHPKEIKKGMHDRLNTTREVLDEYVKLVIQGNYDYKKRALFEDGVLSRVYEKIRSTNIAEDFSQGLYYLQDQLEERTASLCLRNLDINFYSCLRDSSLDFVLSGRCVDIVSGAPLLTRSPYFAHGLAACSRISKFISNKNIKLAELTRPGNQAKSRCVII